MNNNYSHILKSNNEDRYYEYFWLTFKNDILEYVNKTIEDMLIILSENLNNLQHRRDYDTIFQEIKNFMHNYIDVIINDCIRFNNDYKCMHLTKNIKRWTRLDKTFSYIYQADNYKLLSASRNQNKNYDFLFLEYLKFIDTNNIIHLHNLFSFSIKNKYLKVIDIFKTKVDINLFLKNKNSISPKILEEISAKKLLKYFIRT